jgi:hypothetical protein
VFAAKSSDATAVSLSTLLGQQHRGRRLQLVNVVERALRGKRVGAIVIQNLTPGQSKWSSNSFRNGLGIQTSYTKAQAETMGETLRQMLEGYPGQVGPGMDRVALHLLVDASALLNNVQKRLPTVTYSASSKSYTVTPRFIDPETGKPGSIKAWVSLHQLLGILATRLPSLPPSFRSASNAEDVIPVSVEDPEFARHKEAFEIANLIAAEVDGKLVRGAEIKAIVSSIQSKYLSSKSI